MEKELITLINIISELKIENENLKNELKTSKGDVEKIRNMWYENCKEIEELKKNINNKN
jgi:cell division septum initiation protein DivIVA